MERRGWYLITYDIADQRRLARVHYRMRRLGLAMQRSVFLVRGGRSRAEEVLDALCGVMDPAEDDLRAYPVESPDMMWRCGIQPGAGPLLAAGRGRARPGHGGPVRKERGKLPWWRAMLHRLFGPGGGRHG